MSQQPVILLFNLYNLESLFHTHPNGSASRY